MYAANPEKVQAEADLRWKNKYFLDPQVSSAKGFQEAVNSEAKALRDGVPPALLLNTLGLNKEVSTAGAHRYIEEFRAAADDPNDPVERTMLDLIAPASVQVPRLFNLGDASAQNPAAANVFLKAGVGLMDKTAKLVGALTTYRESRRGSHRGIAGSGTTPGGPGR